jgi:hypothetical protein
VEERDERRRCWGSSLVCTRLQRCWVNLVFIPLLQFLFVRFDRPSDLWIDFLSVDSQTLFDHFLQVTVLSEVSVRADLFFSLYESFFFEETKLATQIGIWVILCVCVVWYERNRHLFQNSECTIAQLSNKVKLYSYWWMKSTNVSIVTNYHNCGPIPLHVWTSFGFTWLLCIDFL